MNNAAPLRALAAAVIYVLVFPPGKPPNPNAPRSAWTGSGVRYASADDCKKALARSVVDAVLQKRGPQEVERAKNGVCLRVD